MRRCRCVARERWVLGVARAHRVAGTRRTVQLPGHDAGVGLDEARAGRDEIGEGARARQDLEHLTRRHRKQKVESRRHSLALQERGGGEEIPERRAAIAAKERLCHRLPDEIAHRANSPLFV